MPFPAHRLNPCPAPSHPLARPTDFAQEMKCDGNDLWVCGTFQSDTYAKMFYDAFFRNIVGVQGLGMLGTANDDFCDQYPGSIITVKSYDWGGKYDKTWGSGGQYDWEPTKDTCASCDVDYSFTCPSRPTIQACDVVSVLAPEPKHRKIKCPKPVLLRFPLVVAHSAFGGVFDRVSLYSLCREVCLTVCAPVLRSEIRSAGSGPSLAPSPSRTTRPRSATPPWTRSSTSCRRSTRNVSCRSTLLQPAHRHTQGVLPSVPRSVSL